MRAMESFLRLKVVTGVDLGKAGPHWFSFKNAIREVLYFKKVYALVYSFERVVDCNFKGCV